MTIRLFVMRDADTANRDCKEVSTIAECREYNKKGYGVFMTFNTFEGKRRLAKNVTKICFWACDIDGGDKDKQLEKINKLVLRPSIIVESCNGFHCYWRAKDATIENYEKIERGIIKKLDADPAAKDPARLLRLPEFYHLKNPDKPFLVKIYEKNKTVYSEEWMLYYFAEKETKTQRQYTTSYADISEYTNPDNWERIFKLSSIVKGERNNYLFWIMNRLIDKGLPQDAIKETLIGMNRMLTDPLSDEEITQLLKGKRIY